MSDPLSYEHIMAAIRALPPQHGRRFNEHVELVRQAFEVYASKAPVNRYGPQASAEVARRVFWHHLSGRERFEIEVAVDHSRNGEGRAEFDSVVAPIRRRLFG